MQINGKCFSAVLSAKVLALTNAKAIKNKIAQAGRWKGKSTIPVNAKPLKPEHKIKRRICFFLSRFLKSFVMSKIIMKINHKITVPAI